MRLCLVPIGKLFIFHSRTVDYILNYLMYKGEDEEDLSCSIFKMKTHLFVLD